MLKLPLRKKLSGCRKSNSPFCRNYIMGEFEKLLKDTIIKSEANHVLIDLII